MESEAKSSYRYAVLLLLLASFILSAASLYVSDILAINYGVGAGALIQSKADNTNVTSILVPTTNELNVLHRAWLEAYILFAIAIAMLGSAFMIYLNRSVKTRQAARRYTLLHLALTFIYVALFFIVLSSFSFNLTGIYFWAIYASMFVAVCVDAYLELVIHSPKLKSIRQHGDVRLEPEKPFSNIVALRDTVFATLNGHLRIVDKHFNSDAIGNLHRLIETNLQSIKTIDILTSPSMFDYAFQQNYTDFRNELGNAGIEFNFMIMSDADSSDQHERFVFDDTHAFKTPPLNIINRKSEHVTKLKLKDAVNRFEQLSQNAMKYENYLVKRNQDGQAAGA